MEIVLYIDTCNKDMCVGLSKGDELVYKVQYSAFKRQSEVAAVEIDKCLKDCKVKPSELTKIVVTNGPGSYTGIRIAMTIAKVFCTQMHKTLKCISTMQLFAGMDDSANVILDARSKRAYVAHLEKGVVVGETQILEVDQLEDFLNEHPGTLYGDGYLVNQEAASCDFLKNFIEVPAPAKED